MQSRLRYAKITAIALFVALIPVFLVATNVRWVVNLPRLYSYGFDKYDIPSMTEKYAPGGRIERAELLSAGKQIRDYFNNDEELLDLRVVLQGVRVSLYGEREVDHMKDVKALVRGVYRVQAITGVYLALFAALGLWTARQKFLPRLGRSIGLGGGATLGLVLVVGMASLVGFDRVFLAFHLVSFSNDFWMLDSSRDYLIMLFPQGFWLDAALLCAALTTGLAVATGVFSGVLLIARRRRG